MGKRAESEKENYLLLLESIMSKSLLNRVKSWAGTLFYNNH